MWTVEGGTIGFMSRDDRGDRVEPEVVRLPDQCATHHTGQLQRRLEPEPDRQRLLRRFEPEYDDTGVEDRKSTRLNSSHVAISYAVFCLKKKKQIEHKQAT